jgi:S1-C subfamily serine protease
MHIFRKVVFGIVMALVASLSYAEKVQLEIKVNGLHEKNLMEIEEGGILFSGDSFQLEIVVNSGLYIYSFLLDSTGELSNLDSGFKIPNSTYILPEKNHWYKLDNNAGKETLIVVGSNAALNIEKLSNTIKGGGQSLNTLSGVIVKRFNIKHLDLNIVTRGIQIIAEKGTFANNKDLLYLNGLEMKIPAKNEVPVSGIINKLVNYSHPSEIKTRGIKEVHVFKKASPSVVKVYTKTGSGSGSLISKEGLILTNWHVVKDAKKAGIAFMPKKRGKVTKDDLLIGRVIKINGEADLALIKLDNVPKNIKPLLISNKNPEIGQDVHAIGHPKGGSDWTYTKGYISQLNYNDKWSYKDTTHRVSLMIQSQTPINPGNSGGPLLNNKGKIVGVNSSSSLDYASANYAISAEDVRAFLKQKGDVNTKKKKPKKKPKKKSKKKSKDEIKKVEENLEKISKKLGFNVISVEIVDFTKKGTKDYKISIDDDKNGLVEMTVIVLEDESKGRVIIYDDNEDGAWDEMALDEDNNGKVDTRLFPKEDGKGIGVVGYDDDEDGKVDRYEDFK